MATLVQVANTTSNPVATLNVSGSSSQNVTLFCEISGGICYALGPGGAHLPNPPEYVVPGGENLVITDVEIRSRGLGGANNFVIDPSPCSIGLVCQSEIWSYTDDSTTKEFEFPSGIVYPAGVRLFPSGWIARRRRALRSHNNTVHRIHLRRKLLSKKPL